MPRATAVWLIENTALTFEQIAKFCALHLLEIQAIADDQTSVGMKGVDPIALGQLTPEEIDRCTKDHQAELQRVVNPSEGKKKSRRKYTPIAKRRDRPSAILWLIKMYPELSDSQVCSFLATTRATVQSIREGTRVQIEELTPRSPVSLGLRSEEELNTFIQETHRNVSN